MTKLKLIVVNIFYVAQINKNLTIITWWTII